MATTASGIWYPGPADPITPIENVFSTMAQSVEAAMGLRLFPTTTARDAAYAAQPFKMCVVGSSFDLGTIYVHENTIWNAYDPLAPPTIFGPTRLTASNNLNSLTITGWYDWLGGGQPTNFPDVVNSNGFLTHYNIAGGTYYAQYAYVITSAGLRRWSRQYINPNWTSWSMDAGVAYGKWTNTAGSSDLPTGVFTERLMNATAYQTGGISLSGGRASVPFTGKYFVSIQGSVQNTSATGIRQLVLGINSATDTQLYVVNANMAAAYAWYTNASGIVALNAADKVSMFLFQTGQATGSSGVGSITMQYIGA